MMCNPTYAMVADRVHGRPSELHHVGQSSWLGLLSNDSRGACKCAWVTERRGRSGVENDDQKPE